MKKISLITFCLIVFTLPVSAVTLNDALKQTYENNLELKAERKNLEVQKEVLNICKKIDHENTRLAVTAERAFIKKIGGDCFTPLAALAKINGEKIEIEGKLFYADGSFFSHSKVIKNVNDPSGRSVSNIHNESYE